MKHEEEQAALVFMSGAEVRVAVTWFAIALTLAVIAIVVSLAT